MRSFDKGSPNDKYILVFAFKVNLKQNLLFENVLRSVLNLPCFLNQINFKKSNLVYYYFKTRIYEFLNFNANRSKMAYVQNLRKIWGASYSSNLININLHLVIEYKKCIPSQILLYGGSGEERERLWFSNHGGCIRKVNNSLHCCHITKWAKEVTNYELGEELDQKTTFS